MPNEFRPVHCLSFDIEEHFQVSAFESPMRRQNWDHFESRVERNTEKILELIELRGLRATFFILGWVAERCPKLVRRIFAGGHEIASHGYSHELVTSQTPQEFREDVRKTKAILEDLTGQHVYGYRAPSFSITKNSVWALSILCEEGYGYDTSIVPIIHDRYGIPNALSIVHQVRTESGIIWEIPPSTVSICGMIINPGDIILGDEDGIVAVPLEDATSVLELIKKTIDFENNMEREINDGTLNRDWVDETLKLKGCKFYK